MNEIVQLNSKMKLSEHFTHGEMTKSNSHPEIYNIPSHEAIANMKRLCGWLEVLRSRAGAPIIINSGYRSPQLNKKIGGAANSNHLLSAMRPSLSTTRKSRSMTSMNS